MARALLNPTSGAESSRIVSSNGGTDSGVAPAGSSVAVGGDGSSSPAMARPETFDHGQLRFEVFDRPEELLPLLLLPLLSRDNIRIICWNGPVDAKSAAGGGGGGGEGAGKAAVYGGGIS